MGFLALCLVLPCWAAIDMGARVDSLLARWSEGDEAARTGVVAETIALGEEAVAELYRRLAEVRDFPGRQPGLRTPPAAPERRSDRVISLEVKLAKPKENVWGGKDGRARLLETPEDLLIAGQAEPISAPRLTVYEGQLANITVLNQRTYRRSFDRQGKPVEGLIDLGLMMEARAFVDDDALTVDLRFVRSELAGPMGVVTTPRGQVEIPQVLKCEAAFVLPVESGKPSGLVLPGGKDEGPLIVMITATEVKLEEIELRRGAEER